MKLVLQLQQTRGRSSFWLPAPQGCWGKLSAHPPHQNSSFLFFQGETHPKPRGTWQNLLGPAWKWAGNEGKWGNGTLWGGGLTPGPLGRLLPSCAAGAGRSQPFPNIILLLSFSLQINGPLQRALSSLCSNVFFRAAEGKFGLRRATESGFYG